MNSKNIAKEICKINAPEKMAVILGWYVATYFKPQIMAQNKSFPLLGLFGAAGIEKNVTAVIMGHLHMYKCLGTRSLRSYTPDALITELAKDSLTPVVIDEFTSISSRLVRREQFDSATAALKVNFDGGTISQGTISNPDVTVALTRPVVLIAKSFSGQCPGLSERMVLVKLTEGNHRSSSQEFKWVQENVEKLKLVGDAIALLASRISKEDIAKILKSCEKTLSSRLKGSHNLSCRELKNLSVILTGLTLYEMAMGEELGLVVRDEHDLLRSALMTYYARL